MARIVVVGGYGAFGARVVERLARAGDVDIVIAGRDLRRAEAAAASVRNTSKANIAAVRIDAKFPDLPTLRGLSTDVLINASGPFQAQDYALARACIDAGIHYIDLADARSFVTGITALDAEARAANVLVTSGASTVPAISSAVIDHFRGRLSRLDEIVYGISPGNSFDPGLATTASILGGIGRPIETLRDGAPTVVFGWQGLSRARFQKLGARWMGYCDIPDLTLFAQRYPTLRTIDFRAGVEVSLFHLGLWALSWLVRLGLLPGAERLAAPLLAIKRLLGRLGTDEGGMFVTLKGLDISGRPLRIDWLLIARQGHGPFIPTLVAVILARKLVQAGMPTRGAMPCMGLVSLDEILTEAAELDIHAVQS